MSLSGRDYFTFLDNYLIYTTLSTKAPPLYHTIFGSMILGHAMGYDVVNLIQPSVVHHNMYGCVVGPSTLSNKSTSQDLAEACYPSTCSVPAETSPEQFVVELSEKPDRIWWMPEMSSMLKGIGSGGYMARFSEVLNDLHRCPPVYHRKLRFKKKESSDFLVEKPYLSCASTITPDVLSSLISPEVAVGGFLARWLLVPGEGVIKPRRLLDKDLFDKSQEVQIDIKSVIKLRHPVHFVFTEDALARYNELETMEMKKATKLDNPYVGRYCNYLIALADVLLVDDAIGAMKDAGWWYEDFDNLYELLREVTIKRFERFKQYKQLINMYNHNKSKNSSIDSNRLIVSTEFYPIPVTKEYVDRAWEIIEPCLRYATSVVEDIMLERPIATFRKFVRDKSNGEWIDHSSCMRGTGLNADKMRLAVRTLVERNEIEEKAVEKPTKTGIREVRWYKWKDSVTFGYN